jgi:ATP-dependent Zn protease
MESKYDEATAYHEAGHAVVALALDRPVAKVSIIAGREFLGVCHFQKGVSRASIDLLEREILIALGGIAAEARRTGHFDRAGAGRDLRTVRKLALERVSERQLERYERRMFSKVENLLADEENWLAVQLIASELMKQGMISGRAAKHLFEQAGRTVEE